MVRHVTVFSVFLLFFVELAAAENTPPVLVRNVPLRVDEGFAGTITDSLLLATDAESPPDSITYTVAPDSGGSPPVHGTLWRDGVAVGREDTFTQADVDSRLVSYEHDGSETLFDSFVFRVTDGDGAVASDQGHIDFTFGILVTPVNDPPLARDTSFVIRRDSTLPGLLPGSDPDSPNLIFSLLTNGTLGVASVVDSATGAFTYVPVPDTMGVDTFTFEISDGLALSDPGTVTIDILNLAPVAFDDSLGTLEGVAVPCTLSALDPEADPLTFRIDGPAAHGTAVITDSTSGECTYTPAPYWFGEDAFTFLANDGFADSNAGTVRVEIRPGVLPGRLLVADGGAGGLLAVEPLSARLGIVSRGDLLANARDVALEASGSVLVLDSGNGVIRVDPVTGGQAVLSPGTNFSGGSGVGPIGIATDAAGSVLVADTAFGILRVDPVSGDTTVVAVGGHLEFPANVVESPDGDLYVVDAGGYIGGISKIVLVDPSTGAQTLLSSGGFLNVPIGVALELDGHLLVSCLDTTRTGVEDRVVRIDPGSGAQTLLSTDGLLGFPTGLAITSAGRVYTVANQTASVVEIDPVSGDQSLVLSGGLLQGPFGMTAVPGIPTAAGVREDPPAGAPVTVVPNPLRRSGSVRFSLERAGRVRIGVYDVLGRQVTVLAEGDLPAGSHALSWTDIRLPGGVYFLRLETDRGVETRKVTLLR